MDPQVFTYKHTNILMKYNPQICVKAHFLLKKNHSKFFQAGVKVRHRVFTPGSGLHLQEV